jgi:hypothetical protein
MVLYQMIISFIFVLYMRFPELFRATLAFKQAKLDNLEALKQYKKNYDNGPPDDIREHYDYAWQTSITKQRDINWAHEEVRDLIHALEECDGILEEMHDIIDEIKLTINSRQVGTLEGLSRQSIQNSGIVPDRENVLQEAVLNQPYNELEALRGDEEQSRNGGKGVSKKRKNRVNNHTKRKRNKYVVRRGKHGKRHSK